MLIQNQPGEWAQIIIPAIISLFIVFLDKYVSRYFERRKDQENRTLFRERFLGWIDLIKKPQKEFISSLLTLSEKIASSDIMQPESFMMPQPLPERLNELSIYDITSAFMEDCPISKRVYANKHLYNLLCGLEYQTKIQSQVMEHYDEYNMRANQYCDTWNQSYHSFVDLVNSSYYRSEYADIMKMWAIEQKTNPASLNIHKKYLNQVFETASSFSDLELISVINQLLTTLEQSHALSKGFSTVVRNLGELTNQSLESLTRSATFFSTLKYQNK